MSEAINRFLDEQKKEKVEQDAAEIAIRDETRRPRLDLTYDGQKSELIPIINQLCALGAHRPTS